MRRVELSTSGAEMSCEDATSEPPQQEDVECLKERKWWCFVLSSIFTFLAGLLIVLLWRAFTFLCCRKEPDFAPNDPKQKEQKAARQGKEFEGTFMTEAKDWAGELISGQTTTGRILVSTSAPRSCRAAKRAQKTRQKRRRLGYKYDRVIFAPALCLLACRERCQKYFVFSLLFKK